MYPKIEFVKHDDEVENNQGSLVSHQFNLMIKFD